MHAQGDTTRGLALLEQSVALFDALGDQRGYAWALYYTSRTMSASQHEARIVDRFIESLRIFHALDDARFSADCLAELAKICAGLAQPRAAVRLFAAADILRTYSSTSSATSDDAAHLATLRKMLGETTFMFTWEEGCALTVEQAIALVQQATYQLVET